MSTSYTVGDVVQLKSGGPKMTVQGRSTTNADTVMCQWFAGSKLERGGFPAESIEHVREASK